MYELSIRWSWSLTSVWGRAAREHHPPGQGIQHFTRHYHWRRRDGPQCSTPHENARNQRWLSKSNLTDIKLSLYYSIYFHFYNFQSIMSSGNEIIFIIYDVQPSQSSPLKASSIQFMMLFKFGIHCVCVRVCAESWQCRCWNKYDFFCTSAYVFRFEYIMYDMRRCLSRTYFSSFPFWFISIFIIPPDLVFLVVVRVLFHCEIFKNKKSICIVLQSRKSLIISL